MKTLPLYGMPYLEGSDLGKDIPANSLKLAQQVEAALARGGAVPIGADLQSLLTRVKALESNPSGPADSGWIALPLASGVTAVAGLTPRYRKIGNVVYLEGRASGATTLGTLPAGYRPGTDQRLAMVNGSSGTLDLQVFVVGADGTLRVASTTVSPNMYCTFVVA